MKFKLMDPKEIIAIIVILIVLGVGVYSFFITEGALQSTGKTPVGNNGVLSANRSIHAYTTSPSGNRLTWLNVTGAWNQSTAACVVLQGYNMSTHVWDTVRSTAAYQNVTFIQANSTMRVSIRSFNGSGSVTGGYRWIRCYYSVNGTATGMIDNQTRKSLQNTSIMSSTVFNILGICITISAIFTIVATIYLYMRPKQ
jgi:hypothetical protein